MMKRRGFSVVELLVVFAVVAILAAIVITVFARKREREERRRTAGCQQNLRFLALAIRQYNSDYDDHFPLVSSRGYAFGWADAVEPYARNAQYFQCTSEFTPSVTVILNARDSNYTDYFYNARMSGRKESALSYIVRLIMLGDSVPGNARQHSTGGPPQLKGTATLVDRAGRPVGAATRHMDGANYAFADGHVKWLKGADANTCPTIKVDANIELSPTFSAD
jgi:prepilin-type processing-associated H-X9-DG protein/prepilin-type N-terminal cleavage/methylation domain-containing protein